MKNIDINKFIDEFNIKLEIENRETTFYINEVKIQEEDLQSKQTSIGVSSVGLVADNTKLYKFGKTVIDNLKRKYNIIFSGRSIMQIYPETNYHFFITASLEERVKRKCIQYNQQDNADEIRQNIIIRDELQEKAGFYNLDKKTIEVDVTNCKTIKESTNIVLQHLRKGIICLT